MLIWLRFIAKLGYLEEGDNRLLKASTPTIRFPDMIGASIQGGEVLRFRHWERGRGLGVASHVAAFIAPQIYGHDHCSTRLSPRHRLL